MKPAPCVPPGFPLPNQFRSALPKRRTEACGGEDALERFRHEMPTLAARYEHAGYGWPSDLPRHPCRLRHSGDHPIGFPNIGKRAHEKSNKKGLGDLIGYDAPTYSNRHRRRAVAARGAVTFDESEGS